MKKKYLEKEKHNHNLKRQKGKKCLERDVKYFHEYLIK